MLPFRSGQIVLGTDFCGRDEELRVLRDYLESANRVYVQGERRVGKSSLVCEATRRMRGWRLIHVDLLAVKTIGDVTRRIVHSLVAAEKSEKAVFRLLKGLASLRPTFNVDPNTNQTSIGFASPKAVEAPDTLEQSLNLAESVKKAVLFFDEFQDVLNLVDSGQVLARMRSRIQLLRDVPVAYAGSLRNQMDSIFTDPNAAFYKSAMKINLGPIDKKAFAGYVRKRFRSGGREIHEDLVPAIYELCRGNPGDMQKLCIGLWEVTNPSDAVGPDRIPPALQRVWSQEEQHYGDRLQLLSPQQLACLRALAIHGSARIDRAFVEETGITLTPSVRRAMKGLVQKRFVIEESSTYRFSDPFFAVWIRHKGV